MLRYLVWQIPGWVVIAAVAVVVQGIAAVPWWVAGLFVGAWIVKDLRPARNPMPVGAHGQTVEGGYVRVGGELWRAEARDGRTIAAGVDVVVRGARGLSLVVEES